MLDAHYSDVKYKATVAGGKRRLFGRDQELIGFSASPGVGLVTATMLTCQGKSFCLEKKIFFGQWGIRTPDPLFVGQM